MIEDCEKQGTISIVQSKQAATQVGGVVSMGTGCGGFCLMGVVQESGDTWWEEKTGPGQRASDSDEREINDK